MHCSSTRLANDVWFRGVLHHIPSGSLGVMGRPASLPLPMWRHSEWYDGRTPSLLPSFLPSFRVGRNRKCDHRRQRWSVHLHALAASSFARPQHRGLSKLNVTFLVYLLSGKHEDCTLKFLQPFSSLVFAFIRRSTLSFFSERFWPKPRSQTTALVFV